MAVWLWWLFLKWSRTWARGILQFANRPLAPVPSQFVKSASLVNTAANPFASCRFHPSTNRSTTAMIACWSIAPLAVATEGHFDQTFDVNVKGTFFTVQKALPLFKDGGSIILNSSVSNVLGLPGFTAYAASKAAVRNFARGWTMELKDRKIHVNCMSPGAIDTPALATTTGLTAEQAEQAVAQFTLQIPLGRRGKPEEIAAAVVFLASDESSYITGVDLAVDGGMAQV